ncbi:MAG: uncharacterized membrane protein YciS (DUF1049 family) [Phenylobacterium sp.]
MSKLVKKILFIVWCLVFVLVLLLFAFLGAQNNVDVPLDLLGYQTNIKVGALMAIFLFTGFIFGVIGSIYVSTKVKLQRSMADKKNQRLEKKAAKVAAKSATAEPSSIMVTTPTTIPTTTTLASAKEPG